MESKEKIKKVTRKYYNIDDNKHKGALETIASVFPLFKNSKHENHAINSEKLFKKHIVNPIMKILLTKMIFKAWMGYSKMHMIY